MAVSRDSTEQAHELTLDKRRCRYLGPGCAFRLFGNPSLALFSVDTPYINISHPSSHVNAPQCLKLNQTVAGLMPHNKNQTIRKMK